MKTQRDAYLVNLTNYRRRRRWGCRAHLGYRFPAVPPDADEKAIEIIAEECVAYFPRETSHALVLGEFTFTVELVRRLQARGITCLAATSTRNVEEDVEGQRVSAFTFVRFRPYPEPRSAQMPHGPTWLRGSTKESALGRHG